MSANHLRNVACVTLSLSMTQKDYKSTEVHGFLPEPYIACYSVQEGEPNHTAKFSVTRKV